MSEIINRDTLNAIETILELGMGIAKPRAAAAYYMFSVCKTPANLQEIEDRTEILLGNKNITYIEALVH